MKRNFFKCIWRHMKEFVLMKNHSASQSVKRSSDNHSIWRHMREFILMKNHLAVQSAKKSSHTGLLGRDMKLFIQIENYSAAHSVKRTKNFSRLHNKEFTLAKNHSAAYSVKRSSVNHSIWRPMKEFEQMKNLFITLQLLKLCKLSDSSASKRHERIHTDDKPFCSSKCDKNFSESCNLKKRERIYNNEIHKHEKREAREVMSW